MGTMTFLVNDRSAEAVPQPAVWVSLEEAPDGKILLTARIEGSLVGDLRGLFFDLADESLIGTIQAVAAQGLTEMRQGDDSISDLKEGANLHGLLGSDKGYDVGVEVGTAGIGENDFRSFTVTISSSARPLTLADFANVDFGARTTSVGVLGGDRSASSKLMETTFTAITAVDDVAAVNEDASTSGNLLANDMVGLSSGDTVTITGLSTGELGAAMTLEDTAGAKLTINADGSYVLDASASDALSQGESFTFTFGYTARHENEGTSWATDSASFTVTVNGVNDGPDAVDDVAPNAVDEDATVSGSVLGNDSDVDRLDVLSVTGVRDAAGNYVLGQVTLASGAKVTMAANGSYTYDPNDAFDSLNQGQTATDTFTYQVLDGKGGTDTATVTVTISGSDDGPARIQVPDNLFPVMGQKLGNVVLYFDDGNQDTPILKVRISPEDGRLIYDIDDLQLEDFVNTHLTELGANTTIIAASIHAGNEYPTSTGSHAPVAVVIARPPSARGGGNEAPPTSTEQTSTETARGEGTFYVMDDTTPIVPPGEEWEFDDIPLTPEAIALGLNGDLLIAAPSYTYTFTGSWIL